MSFDRRELQVIRDRALQTAQSVGSSNVLAMRAYADLAASCDRLDAMLARDQGPPARAPVQNSVPAPRSTRELAQQVQLESEVDENGDPLEYYDPSNG